jgi:hypothetical protein
MWVASTMRHLRTSWWARSSAVQHRGVAAHQPVQAVAEFLESGERTQVFASRLSTCSRNGAEFEPGGSLGGELLGVFAGKWGCQDFFRAPGKAKLGVTLLFGVDAIDKMREFGQCLQGKNDVLVHLEGVGAAGNRAQFLAVRPEALGLGGIAGHEQHGVGMLRQQTRESAPRRGRPAPRCCRQHR